MVDKAKAAVDTVRAMFHDSAAFKSLTTSSAFDKDSLAALKDLKAPAYNPNAGDSYGFGSGRSFTADHLGGTIPVGAYTTGVKSEKHAKHAKIAKHAPVKDKQGHPKLKPSEHKDHFYRPDTEYAGFGSGRSFNPDLGGIVKVSFHDKKSHQYTKKINRSIDGYLAGALPDRKSHTKVKVDPEVVAKYKAMRNNQHKARQHHKHVHLEPTYSLAFNPDTNQHMEKVKG